MKSKNALYFICSGNGSSRPISVPAPMTTVVACDNKGFTLVELIVVTVIIGILASIAIFSIPTIRNKVGIAKCQAELRAIEKDISAYMIDTGALPASLNVIHRDGLRDLWGRPYQYLNLASAGTPRQDSMLQNYNADFDLYSLGPDGASAQDFDDPTSKDDIIRSGDGTYVGTRSF